VWTIQDCSSIPKRETQLLSFALPGMARERRFPQGRGPTLPAAVACLLVQSVQGQTAYVFAVIRDVGMIGLA
jgi:hypothetical protein